RMRRFAEDIFGARDIELHFHAPEPGRDLKVGADLRREVFLIFKESVNNMVRHSHCTSATIELQVEHGWLALRLSENGRGCDLAKASEGNGLASMHLRAKKLGGSLEVVSINHAGHDGHDEERGTSVTLRAPLDQRGRG